MLLGTPSYKKLFKHMIILSNSIKVEFFEGPKLVKDNLQKIEKSLDLFFKEFNLSKIDVEVGFATKSEMKNINFEFRNKNKVTNVLSFPEKEHCSKTNKCIGEVIFCMPILQEESVKYEKKNLDHFQHLFFHSLLHLIGYMHDKESDAILMEQKEIKFLSKIGISNPYS